MPAGRDDPTSSEVVIKTSSSDAYDETNFLHYCSNDAALARRSRQRHLHLRREGRLTKVDYGNGSVLTYSNDQAGDLLSSIQVTFSAAMTVTGTPQLALNSCGSANYSSGSGAGTLIFTYTVGAGDSSAHLDYASAAALGGGAINSILTLPAGTTGSLGVSTKIVIGGALPPATPATTARIRNISAT